MKITLNNLEVVPEKEQPLMESLLDDIKCLHRELYIDRQDYHNEYSPERTDPCPDYFGYYSLIDKETGESIGDKMRIEDLDLAIYLISEYDCLCF